MPQIDKIKIELSIGEINVIIKALGNLPFIEVYKLIEKLHLQANNALKNNTNNNVSS